MAKSYDYLFKLYLVGDSNAGKSQILHRFTDDHFSVCFLSNIGIDFKVKTIEIDEKKIKLQIWDIAGDGTIHTNITGYYQGAMGLILVYNVNNETSFENVKRWMETVEENAASEVEMILIGNRLNHNNDKQVLTERGEELSSKFGIKFMEVSSEDSSSVNEAFYTLAKDIKIKLEKKMELSNSEAGEGSQHKSTQVNNEISSSTKTCSIL